MSVQIPDAYVRTLPHYLPRLRTLRPTKMTVLVCGSRRERVDVVLRVEGIRSRFHWPLGPKLASIICWRDVGSPKDVCTGEITIWPWTTGSPKLTIESPDGTFAKGTVETIDDTAPLRTHSLHRPGGETPSEENIMSIRNLIVATMAAAVGLVVGFYVGEAHGLSTWASTSPPIEELAPMAVLPEESPVELPPAETLPTMPPPVALAPEPAAPAQDAVVLTSRDCTFADSDRAEDAQGKVAIVCTDGSAHQARAVYIGEGRFEFREANEDPIGP
ncbi:hypothetical protein HY631_00715 [Candidatus Uhrbacteria bacterium]|nr:hypothetical protein [Candidatus Uhrbacteria bacterium]